MDILCSVIMMYSKSPEVPVVSDIDQDVVGIGTSTNQAFKAAFTFTLYGGQIFNVQKAFICLLKYKHSSMLIPRRFQCKLFRNEHCKWYLFSRRSTSPPTHRPEASHPQYTVSA